MCVDTFCTKIREISFPDVIVTLLKFLAILLFLCMRKELQNVHFVLSSVAKFDIFCDHPIPVLCAVLGSV